MKYNKHGYPEPVRGSPFRNWPKGDFERLIEKEADRLRIKAVEKKVIERLNENTK